MRAFEGRRVAVLALSPLAFLVYFFFQSKYALIASTAIFVAMVVYGLVIPLSRIKFPSSNVDLDLVYALLHMLSVSTGKPPVSYIFKSVSEEGLYPVYREIFRKIYVLGKEWGYSFADACRLVARTVNNKIVREILARLGSVLAVGEDVEQFLRLEYSTIMSEFETQHSRSTDALRIVLGVYSSLLAAATFMIASLVVLAFFFGDIGERLIVSSFTAVTIMILAAAATIGVAIPTTPFENKLKPYPRLYGIIDVLAPVMLACSAAISYLLLRKMGLSITSIALGLGATGALLLVPGYAAKSIERLVNDVDLFFPVFIRSYGMHLQTLPQMDRALKPILVAELGKLNKTLENLYARLSNNIDPFISWRLFSAETRSELVARSVRIFLDTFERGGRLADVGALLSDTHNTIVRLRKARLEVGKTFESAISLMHALIALIVVFVSRLAEFLSSVLVGLQAAIPTDAAVLFFFQMLPRELLTLPIALMLIASVLSTSLVASKAIPGVSRSFWYYVSVLAIFTTAGAIAGDQMVGFIVARVVGPLANVIGDIVP
uniref:Type II secretion system protein GspF domain-containing protein n=1 Tax=Fervidicoccus fontis TaxID=683846 RepID=A0A7J3ZM90_9CREN